MFPIESNLQGRTAVQFALADQRDIEPLKALYRVIVEEGTSYPHERFPDHDEFVDYWLRGKQTVVAYVPDRERAGVAEAFYLSEEYGGRPLNFWIIYRKFGFQPHAPFRYL